MQIFGGKGRINTLNNFFNVSGDLSTLGGGILLAFAAEAAAEAPSTFDEAPVA